MTANYWPLQPGYFNIDKLFFMLTRLINIGSCIANFFMMWFALFIVSYPDDWLRYLSAGIDLAIVIRTISVLPVQFFNQRRLQHVAHSQDVRALDESVKIASIFGIVSTCSTILGTVLMANSAEPVNAGIFATEYFLGAYLTFNMFFLILDIKVSSLLLDQLHLLADSRQLTMDTFQAVKTEIHRRVGESRWASDLIIVPCIASVVAIAVLVLFFMDAHFRPAVKIETAAFIALMLKELFFVAVAFWYIAQVNAKADELTAKLSRSVWGVYGDCSSVSSAKEDEHEVSKESTGGDGSIVSNTNANNGSTLHHRKAHTTPSTIVQTQLSDMYRLSIHANSISEPISFTLVFKRITWVNVAVSGGGFGLTLLAAFVKNVLITSG